MSKRGDIYEFAADQWGLLTAGQARSVGVTSQMMAKMAVSGDLVRIAHGVYRVAGSPIHEHEDLRVAWLGLDPARTAGERLAAPNPDVVSHRSATRLRGLGDLAADVMEFTVGRRRQTRRDDVRLHRGTVTAKDWNLVDGLPVTTARRLIDDLAAERIDRGHLAGIVRDALSREPVSRDDLVRVLARHARGYGVQTGNGSGLLSVLLDEATGRPTRAIVSDLDPADLQALVSKLDPDLLQAIARHLRSQPTSPASGITSAGLSAVCTPR